jgi:transcriptional regulator with XRE-family HTH domain
MAKLHPLKLKRLEQGLSQYALSSLSGVPQVYICYAERGYPTLKKKHKEALARALNTVPPELFGDLSNGMSS